MPQDDFQSIFSPPISCLKSGTDIDPIPGENETESHTKPARRVDDAAMLHVFAAFRASKAHRASLFHAFDSCAVGVGDRTRGFFITVQRQSVMPCVLWQTDFSMTFAYSFRSQTLFGET